jgi:hypothetical protein
MTKLVLLRTLLLALLLLAGCSGPGRVQFDDGKCFKDGVPLSLQNVEEQQAIVAQRISSRQPWFAVITIGVVMVAAAGNVEKVLLLVRARHVQGHKPLAERLREVIERHRQNAFRFAALVGLSLSFIVVGGGSYVYLDIDKRASERALGMLQFCHLALRTQEEEGVLDEQRHNLEAIQSTAGDIRTLVGKLPPDEQRKAQLIVDQMNTALAKQGKIVGQYVARTDEAQKDLSAHTAAMEKGLASVQGEIAELRSLPANVKDLETAAHKIDETTTSFDGRFGDLRSHVAELDTKLDALLARPACPPPPAPAPKASAGAAAAPAKAAPAAEVDAGRASASPVN